MIGTRGVPARYGGFETAVEEIGGRLASEGHQVLVYSRFRHTERFYQGMEIVTLPAVPTKSLETLSHTLMSVGHVITSGRSRRPDVAVVFNSANAPFIPILRALGIPVAVNVDGLEWKRAKWSGSAARYFRWSERIAVAKADAVIADAQGIADHIMATHGLRADVIPYGAPVITPSHTRLHEAQVSPDAYHIVVARFEPENHVLEIVRAYAESSALHPLLVVGDAPYSDTYRQAIARVAQHDPRITLLGSIWDQELLDQLYGGARSYLHGHSVGGTNPSLLRALGAGAPTTAFDVSFNREVTGGHARFFSTTEDLRLCIEADDQHRDSERANEGREFVAKKYQWSAVAQDYLELCTRIAGSIH